MRAEFTRLSGMLSAAAIVLASACATGGESVAGKDGGAEPRWQATGYLTPGRSGAAEVIGQFADKKECDAAAAGWMSRQVVGNPIFAECLPIDTH